jgi:predicted PurR-regulated permease PerM
MRAKTEKRIIYEFGTIAHTVIYAQLFVALIQGIIGTIGFFIFGVPLPILLGVVLAFCALIPHIGTALIWLPISIFMILSGYLSHDYWLLSRGIGLFLYGMLIISTVDNILLARIVHTKAKVNQIIVIIGVIGGAAMFGIVGIFIGPILLPLLLTYFETFKERFV